MRAVKWRNEDLTKMKGWLSKQEGTGEDRQKKSGKVLPIRTYNLSFCFVVFFSQSFNCKNESLCFRAKHIN